MIVRKKVKVLATLLVVMAAGAMLLFSGCANSENDNELPLVAPAASTGPVPLVGLDVCTNCHPAQVTQWMTGHHANFESWNSTSLTKYDQGMQNTGHPSYKEFTDNTCVNCHDKNGDGYLLAWDYTGNVPRPVIGCESCHGGGANHFGIGGFPYPDPDYNRCLQCHDPNLNTPANADHVKISTNHALVPGDLRQNTGPGQEFLYFVNLNDPKACIRCHSPHAPDNTVNDQYARSGHGDALGDPWIHYNWKQASRQACQRCHTATGARNYLSDPANYNAANNDFSYLILGTQNGPGLDNGQAESLYCWACHTDYRGTIRNPGPITADYVSMTGGAVTFPDILGSNVCMACHIGRESGGSIQNSTGNFANLSFINSHYLSAGAIVFKASGYEYTVVDPTLDYANVAYYHHDKIGTDAFPGTGNNGPCAGCHMQTAEPHLFEPLERDVGGNIIAIVSTACSNTACHSGPYALTVADITTAEEEFKDGMAAFEMQLEDAGYVFAPSHPYFYIAYDAGYTETGNCNSNLAVKNWQSGGTNTYVWNPATSKCDWTGTGGTPGTGKQNMGAAFNYNLLEHDPGAFAHNRMYTKRLIYDSIDWLDDNLMNDSVKATLNGPDHTGQPYLAGAIDYLLADPACTPTVDCRP